LDTRSGRPSDQHDGCSERDSQPLFILLSFEGPDPYAKAGGLASRETELSEALADFGYDVHLFFVGDPLLPGIETREQGQGGRLTLHRWCQWISRYHPGGVYDGEEGKLRDWNSSLPTWLSTNVIGPAVEQGRQVVVLAEEWHTAASVIALRRLLAAADREDGVKLLWNANNTFGFDRIDWNALRQSATVTTISRYMRAVLAQRGVEAWVVPNGIAAGWLADDAPASARTALSEALPDRMVLTKIARWDPDKNWENAVSAVDAAKRRGLRPLLLARGGMEAYGESVFRHAHSLDLNVQHIRWPRLGLGAMFSALRSASTADIVVMDERLEREHAKALYSGSFAVLANSDKEPFGLVGLETMACGGVAFVGSTGEDYATNGHDSFCLQSRDPWELVRYLERLMASPRRAAAMRKAARVTAERFHWHAVLERVLVPILGLPQPPLPEFAKEADDGHEIAASFQEPFAQVA
jgi:glycosyltransferase involved in cell wall biosynthesis